MSRVSKRTLPSRDDDPVATAQLLPLGANVRLRGREAIGVIVGNSPDIDRFQVQWDDTGMVTHCLKANLELVAAVRRLEEEAALSVRKQNER